MNVAFFLTPKAQVAYLKDDYTIRQAIEKMRVHKYTAIPVITRDGKYVGTVSEGDFLWYLLDTEGKIDKINVKDIEELKLKDMMVIGKNPPVQVTTSVDELLNSALQQNFVPVVDDNKNFIGIVTRKDIIKFLLEKK